MGNNLLKSKLAFVGLMIIAIIYFVSIIYIAFSISLQWSTLVRCIMVFSSIIAFAILVKMNVSVYLNSFSIPFVIFILFDVIYPLFNSVISHKDLLFYNTSFLSHTEGYLFFSFLVYFMFNRKKEID